MWATFWRFRNKSLSYTIATMFEKSISNKLLRVSVILKITIRLNFHVHFYFIFVNNCSVAKILFGTL